MQTQVTNLQRMRVGTAVHQPVHSRIIGPIKEFQGILKVIRKSITKRQQELVDYDQYNNSLTKLRDKKEKTSNDGKSLFKLEQDFEIASNEYDFVNTAVKNELRRLLVQATQPINALFHTSSTRFWTS